MQRLFFTFYLKVLSVGFISLACLYFPDSTLGSTLSIDNFETVLEATADASMLPLANIKVAEAQLERLKNQSQSTRSQDLFGKWQYHLFGELTEYALYHPNDTHRMQGSEHGTGLFFSREVINNILRIGSSIAFGRADYDSLGSQTEFDTLSTHFALTINYEREGFFADAFVQASRVEFMGKTQYRSSNTAPLPPAVDTHGNTLGLSLQSGYDLSFEGGRWAYGPHLALTHLNSEVDRHTRSKEETSLEFFEQRFASKSIEFGVFFKFLNLTQTFSVAGQLDVAKEFDMKSAETQALVLEPEPTSLRLTGYSREQSTRCKALISIMYATSPNSRLGIQYVNEKGEQAIEGVRVNAVYNF